MLAHEISHISNNDLFVMLVSDVTGHITSVMSTTGYILILKNIPQFVLMGIKAL